MERVLINYGNTGENLTPFDGDLNGDGVVDVEDMEIVINYMGSAETPPISPAITPLPLLNRHVRLLMWTDVCSSLADQAIVRQLLHACNDPPSCNPALGELRCE